MYDFKMKMITVVVYELNELQLFSFSLFHSVSDILAFVILSSLKKIDTVFKVTLFYFIIKIT